jgi:hypothetical protein
MAGQMRFAPATGPMRNTETETALVFAFVAAGTCQRPGEPGVPYLLRFHTRAR